MKAWHSFRARERQPEALPSARPAAARPRAHSGFLPSGFRRMLEPFAWNDAVLVLLVAGVGAVAALATRGFERAVDLLFELGYAYLPAYLVSHGWPHWIACLIYPGLLGLAVAGVKRLVPGPDRGHSVPLVIVSMQKRKGRLHPLSTLLKTVSAILTLGAGGSLGREGPVVLLGGGLGSAVGQLLRQRPENLNTLIAAGAGAAIATAFHAPITGALFAMEIVLIRFSGTAFAHVALASVTATALSRLLVGAPPFPIPSYGLRHPWEIGLYILLGVAVAPLGRAYVAAIHGSEHLGARLRVPDWAKPALGGMLFGAVAIVLPRTLGGGYGTISDALAGRLALATMVILLLAKFLTIGLTSGGGWPGGVFTPALFLGAMAGGVYGAVLHGLGLAVQPGAYAVVGMSAMIASATQAPLTAIMLVFEVTRDYQIAIPAMLACGIAAVFSRRISPYSIDTLHLPEHGILLPWQVHDLREITVEDAMARDVHTVRADMTLEEVIRTMQRHRHSGYPVLDGDGRLVGLITLQDVRATPLEGRLSRKVSEVMSTRLATLTPDQTLADAALLLARRKIGRLPVVDPSDPGRLVGIISRSDVLYAYPGEHEQPHISQGFFER